MKSGNKSGIKIYNQFIPDDIKKIILDKQTEQRINCKCMISQVMALYKIIREWKELKHYEQQAKFIASKEPSA